MESQIRVIKGELQECIRGPLFMKPLAGEPLHTPGPLHALHKTVISFEINDSTNRYRLAARSVILSLMFN